MASGINKAEVPRAKINHVSDTSLPVHYMVVEIFNRGGNLNCRFLGTTTTIDEHGAVLQVLFYKHMLANL